jgi:hypothetical protein
MYRLLPELEQNYFVPHLVFDEAIERRLLVSRWVRDRGKEKRLPDVSLLFKVLMKPLRIDPPASGKLTMKHVGIV